MRTINICRIHELKGEAKEKAREWWRNLERQDPAWYSEHFNSLKHLSNLLQSKTFYEINFCDSLREIIRQCKACELTGYCADSAAVPVLEEALAKGFENYKEDEVIKNCQKAYDREWREEMTSRMKAAYVDEAIDANDHEFFEDGTPF